MAYSNNFPINYQPYYSQIGQQAQTPSSNMIWVQGEAGAKSYLVAPNSTVTLWDSESHTIYLKSADAMGMPTMKVLDYEIRDPQRAQSISAQSDFATKDEVVYLRNEIEALRAKFDDLKGVDA